MRLVLCLLLSCVLAEGLVACDGGDGDADADSDGDVDADADADSDGGDECGDAEVLARYDVCTAAEAQEACEAAGGTWGPIGIFSADPLCVCPTSQRECPCTRGGQCLSQCIAPPNDGVMDCEGVTEGHCAPVSLFAGCHCFLHDDGTVSGRCLD
jgi:hypothetical protein